MTKKSTAELFLFATTFIWSSTFVVIKWGLEELSPFLLLALRFSIAALLFFPIIARSLASIGWATIREGSLLGLLLFFGLSLQTIGLEYTTASKSAFITGLMVVLTPLVLFVVYHRVPSRANVIGIGIVIAGLWLLTNPPGGSPGGGLNLGDGLTLLCALAFAGFIVYLDQAARRHEVLLLTFVQILSLALYSWAAVGLTEPFTIPSTITAWWTTAYLAIAATMVTGYIMTRYQRDTTPTRAAVIYSLEPVWAALMAAYALTERLGAVAMLGAGLILLGVLFSELFDVKPTSAHR